MYHCIKCGFKFHESDMDMDERMCLKCMDAESINEED